MTYRLIISLFTALMLIIAQQSRAFGGGISDGIFLADTTNVPLVDTIASDDLGLESEIHYFGKDSTVVDVVNEKIYLYGSAWVQYGEMRVDADFISFSFSDFTAHAVGKLDSTGTVIQKATFAEGASKFEEDSLGYNFKTKKGISYGVRTKEDQIYLLSEVSKKAPNNWVSVARGMLTTCDHPNPHFHFRLSKAMVIPDDKVVSGPVVLKFRKVPLFALPFGYFPNKRESAQGILLPGYSNANQKGFFLQNLGYYVPINDNVDTKVTFDIYTRGSWAVRNGWNYKKIYKHNGNFNFSYQNNKTGFPELSSYNEVKSFNIQWNHSQDPRSRPNTTFSAAVNLGSINNFRQNLNVSQSDYLSNTFNSSINWSKRWPDRPFNIGLVARHSQNTQTRNVDVTLPQLSANLTRITLGRFAKNNPSLKTFLDNFGFDANMNADNRVSGKNTLYRWDKADSLLMQSKNGIRTGANLSASIRAKQYFTMSFNLRGESYHAMRYLQQQFNEDTQTFQRDTLFGFKSASSWSASTNINTRLYGTAVFRKAKYLKAIRHVMQPRAGLSYTPYTNYRTPYLNTSGSVSYFSEFDLASVSPPTSGEALSANFALQQNWEAKIRDRSQAKVSYKKVKLIESWNTAISRNFLADSLNWSNLTMSAFTTIRENIQVTYNSSYSLYDRDSLGRDINTFLAESKGEWLRMQSTSLAVNFSLKSSNKRKLDRADQELTSTEQDMVNQNQQNLIDFSVPWTLNVKYTFGINNRFSKELQSDTIALSNRIMFNGDITFLKRFALSVNSGYDMSNARYKSLEWKDFGLRDFSSTTIGFHVDLHCWEFNVTYVPFGLRQSYMAQINIKSPLLRDLKLQRRGTFGDQNNLW